MTPVRPLLQDEMYRQVMQVHQGTVETYLSSVLTDAVFAIPFACLKERCSPRQKSRVEGLRAKLEPLITQVSVATLHPTPNSLNLGLGV